YPLNDVDSISPRPLLFFTGDEAHSREFSEDAYAGAAEPKELYWVAGAGHVDLYDRVDLIPFDKFTEFFTADLAANATHSNRETDAKRSRNTGMSESGVRGSGIDQVSGFEPVYLGSAIVKAEKGKKWCFGAFVWA
ncbi:hypothetical protein PI125_g20989, partial [Phytophthora idaei]